jgi:predicted GIY-YIG superfamily endonuclease
MRLISYWSSKRTAVKAGKSEKMIYVYWIHHESQSDPTTEGYIGVTNDTETRLRSHKRSKNLLVASNIAKGAVLDILHVRHDYADAYALEESYRPDVRGWNLAKGGLGGVGSSMPDGWHTERNRKRYLDPAQRDKTAEATILAYKDPALRKKTSDASKKMWQDPEYRDKQKHKPGNFRPVMCEGVRYESRGAAEQAYGQCLGRRFRSDRWPDFIRLKEKGAEAPSAY